jgi:hypothetical protein
MKVWIFENVKVSNSYHPYGGLVFIAENSEQIMDLLPEHAELDEEDWESVRMIEHLSFELPKVFIFPDSGCC